MAEKKKPWLSANVESDELKAQRKRIAKEQNASIADTLAKLDEELAKAKPGLAAPPAGTSPPEPTIAAAPVGTPAQRTTPRLVRDDPIPQPVSERPTPRAVGEPAPSKATPDPQLIELAKLWPMLSEAQRMQLVMFAKVMIHFGR
jgi:hypothetical protein